MVKLEGFALNKSFMVWGWCHIMTPESPDHRTTPNKPVSNQDIYDTFSGQVAAELMQLLHESKYV